LNLNFLIKKKHIFKRRKRNVYIPEHNYKNFTNGIYSRNQIRFEFVYLKTFKRFFKRKKRKKRKKYTKNTKY
jgi:hypothetical protein